MMVIGDIIGDGLGTEELSIWMTDGLGKELRHWRVPNIVASDLLEFLELDHCDRTKNAEKLDRTQEQTQLRKHHSQATYNCVTLGFCCNDIPCCKTRPVIGEWH